MLTTARRHPFPACAVEYHAVVAESAAFVLAGGRSSRMGRDKALLRLDGLTLLERALAIARAASPEVKIVGQRDKFTAYAPVIEDLYPGQGPLAGIHAALSGSQSELNFIMALDTPFLDARFVRYLMEQAERSVAIVTVPRVGERTHPLCAVYRREFTAVAETALRQQRNSIVPLYAKVSTREIGEVELRGLGFETRMFDNLNTPEEWEQACRRART